MPSNFAGLPDRARRYPERDHERPLLVPDPEELVQAVLDLREHRLHVGQVAPLVPDPSTAGSTAMSFREDGDVRVVGVEPDVHRLQAILVRGHHGLPAQDGCTGSPRLHEPVSMLIARANPGVREHYFEASPQGDLLGRRSKRRRAGHDRTLVLNLGQGRRSGCRAGPAGWKAAFGDPATRRVTSACSQTSSVRPLGVDSRQLKEDLEPDDLALLGQQRREVLDSWLGAL